MTSPGDVPAPPAPPPPQRRWPLLGLRHDGDGHLTADVATGPSRVVGLVLTYEAWADGHLADLLSAVDGRHAQPAPDKG